MAKLQDLRRPALARVSHAVAGEGTGARLRQRPGRFRHRRDPRSRPISRSTPTAMSRRSTTTASCCGSRWRSTSISPRSTALGTLYPKRLEDEARAWQWSFWGMTEIERHVLTAMFNRAIYPEDKRDAAAADAGREGAAAPARRARRRGGQDAVPDRRRLHRRRPQRRQHPVLGAAGADRFRPVPESRRLAQPLRRCARRPRRRAICSDMTADPAGPMNRRGRHWRRRWPAVRLGATAARHRSTLIGGRKAMAAGTPETVVYVSNAGSQGHLCAWR